MDARHLNTPAEILRAAREKEPAARDYYAKLANRCTIGFVQELLFRLQNEEEKHMDLIRKLLTRLADGPSPA